MFEDLPYEIVQRRKRLTATIKKAMVNKDQAAFSKAQPNKLFVRDKLWPEEKTSIFLCSTSWINLGNKLKRQLFSLLSFLNLLKLNIFLFRGYADGQLLPNENSGFGRKAALFLFYFFIVCFSFQLRLCCLKISTFYTTRIFA